MKQMFLETQEKARQKVALMEKLEALFNEYVIHEGIATMLRANYWDSDIFPENFIQGNYVSSEAHYLLSEVLYDMLFRGLSLIINEEEERIDYMQVGIDELERCGY